MRVVLDTNVVASRYVSPIGPPARIFSLWETNEFELIISEAILAEYKRVLMYPHLQARHRMDDQQIDVELNDLRRFATVVEVDITLTVITEDPSDNKFVECAVAGDADYIVSGDKHLLDLGEYRGIQILSPAIFLALFPPKDS